MTAPDHASSGELAALLSAASVEVSSRGNQLQELRDNFRPGTDVTITFLPGDNYRHNVETAAALRRAGFNPVPHIAAREMPSREALEDFLARARGEADAPYDGEPEAGAADITTIVGPLPSTAELKSDEVELLLDSLLLDLEAFDTALQLVDLVLHDIHVLLVLSLLARLVFNRCAADRHREEEH